MITRAEMDARDQRWQQQLQALAETRHQELLQASKANSIRSAVIAAVVSLTVTLIHAAIAWLTR